MSESGSGANGGGVRDDRADEWDATLATLDEAIAEATRKIESGRVRDVEKEKARIKRLNAVARLADVRRKVLKDSSLADMEAKMAEIEARAEQDGRSRWRYDG